MTAEDIKAVFRTLIDLNFKGLIDPNDAEARNLLAIITATYAATLHPKDFENLCNIVADFCTVASHDAEIRKEEIRKSQLN